MDVGRAPKLISPSLASDFGDSSNAVEFLRCFNCIVFWLILPQAVHEKDRFSLK